MLADGGTTNATTVAIAAAAGLAGVFIGGWMARSRERWRWRVDNRRDAYVELLRAVTEVHDSFDDLVRAERGDRAIEDVGARATAVRRAARGLDAARAGVRILGSPAMRDYVDNEDMGSFILEARYSDAEGLASIWDAVEDDVGTGWVNAAIDWADDIERIAVGELSPDGMSTWVERRFRRWTRWRHRHLRQLETAATSAGQAE